MEKRNLPVGIFDSGVGGISVLREIIRLMPQEDYYFFGDSLHAPYGTKTTAQIQALTLENVAKMRDYGIKAVVIACNTATSAAIALLRERYQDMPVIGIEPALKPAVHIRENPRVLVMATPATVEGKKFHLLLERYHECGEVIPVACPGLMEYVERGELSGESLHQYLTGLFAPYTEREIDAVVLGCTHYPFIKAELSSVLGEKVQLLDGSEGTARELRRRLAEEDLLTDREGEGRVVFEMSIPQKEELCRKLLYM